MHKLIYKVFSAAHLPETAVGLVKCALCGLRYGHVIYSEVSDSLRVM